MPKDGAYDLAVVGGGPAGLSAAIQAARSGLSTLVLQGFEAGGRLLFAEGMEAYPGAREGATGHEMADRMEGQARAFGAELSIEYAVRADLSSRPFRLWEEGADEPRLARSVVVATGAKPRRLDVPGEERLLGRGVSYCAIMDALLFRGKRVAVVGGGENALEEALRLARFASEVIVVHRRSRFRAPGWPLGRARAEPTIRFLTNAVVEEVLGEGSVEGVAVRGTRVDARRVLEVEGLFVAIGYDPYLGPFSGLLETDADGYVVRGERTMTGVPGVFAAGEVADGRYRQTATAVGDGARAALDAREWLEARGLVGGP